MYRRIRYYLICKFTCFKLHFTARLFKYLFSGIFLYLLPGVVLHRITLSTTVDGSWSPRDQPATQRMLEVRESPHNRLHRILPGVYRD